MGAASLQPLRVWLDAIWQLSDNGRSLAIKFAIVSIFSLAITALIASTPFYRNLQFGLLDWAHSMLSADQNFSDVILIDADQDSMDILAPSYGVWPYDRSVYAGLIDYLYKAGARVVVVEPLLELERDKDEKLQKTISKIPGIVLGAGGLNTVLPRSKVYYDQLASLSWLAPDELPTQVWPEFALPHPRFTENSSKVVVGVHNYAIPGESNAVRSIPIAHRAHGRLLASLPLATIARSGDGGPHIIEYSHERKEVGFGGHIWPVDDEGAVWPIIANNIDNLPSIPMWQVLLEAGTGQDAQFFAEELRNRTVFIGSTSVQQGSGILTARGRLPSLHYLAASYYSLQHGQVMRPISPFVTALMVLLAMMILLLTLRSKWARVSYILLAAGVAASLVLLAFFAFLLFNQQLTDPMFAWFALALGTLLLVIFRAKYHVDTGQKLFYEKQAAEDANQLKSDFLAHMTHELRTPLTAVIGFNRLLAEEEHERDHGGYRKIVDSNCQHLLQLINNILDHSKLIAGQMLLEPTAVNVPKLIHDAVGGLEPLASEKGLKLRMFISDSMPERLIIDELRLRQVLINIVGNAIKFTDRGYVEVRANWDNGWLELDVEDTGCGIPDAVRERIFESFQQASGAIARHYGGTGLGLTISRDLARLMGGNLSAISEEGNGATFSLSVPAPYSRPPDSKEQSDSTKTAIDWSLMVGQKILVADDNADIRALVTVYLKKTSVSVMTAENGEQAVEKGLRERPNLILMDMEMPVMDGYEAIAALRSRGFKAPIVGFTAHSSDEIQKTIRDMGADGCIRKPVDKELMLETVYKHMLEYQQNLQHEQSSY